MTEKTTLNLDNIDLASLASQPITAEELAKQQKKTQLNSSLSQAVQVDPAHQAQMNTLSRQSGVPAQAIESDVKSVETHLKLKNIDLDSLVEKSPATSKLLSDYNKAAMAHDDIDNLKTIEEIVAGLEGGQAASIEELAQRQDAVPEDPNYLLNLGRGVLDRTTDLAGALSNFVSQAGDYLEEEIPLGGFTFANGIPMYVPPEQFKKMKEAGLKDPFEEFTKAAKGADFGYVPQGTWEEVEKSFSEGNYLSTAADFVLFGTEQLVVSVPDMVAAAAGSGVALPAYVLARGEQLGQERAQNKSIEEGSIVETMEALPGAALSSMLEAILPARIFKSMDVSEIEMVGREIIEGTITKASQVATRAAEGVVIESATEFVQEGIIEYITERYGTDAPIILDEMLKRGAIAASAGGFGGGALGGTTELINVNTQALQDTYNNFLIGRMDAASAKQAKLMVKQAKEQRSIDGVNEYATNSQLRELDPEAFRQFVEDADADRGVSVFIDGLQTKLYLDTKGADTDPALDMLRGKVVEAAALGNDIQLSIADFATTIAGTEHFDALRDSMTMSAETTAPFRQEQQKQEHDSYIKKIVAEAQENVSQYAEAQDIYASVREQLVDSGMVSTANAKYMAQVVPAWATSYAARNGISVQEAYERSGLVIEGPQTGEAARLDAEEALLQSAFRDGQDIFENVKNDFLDTFEEDAGIDDVMGRVDDMPANYRPLFKALNQAEWLGYSYPSQALNALLVPDADLSGLTPGVKQALGRLVNVTMGVEPTVKSEGPTRVRGFDNPNPKSFVNLATAALAKNPQGNSATIYPASEYAKMDLYTIDGGKAGFAIENGMLLSVFKDPSSTIKGFETLVPAAIRAGARELEAFEGVLTENYAKYGFVETARVPWDDDYAPDGWDYETQGRPDLVSMKLQEQRYEQNSETDANTVQNAGRVRAGDGEVRGRLQALEGAPSVEGVNGPIEGLLNVAEQYARDNGIDLQRQIEYVEVDPERATRIADAYEQMKNDPNDPEVKEAYENLIEQTMAQYQALIDAGYEFWFVDLSNDDNLDYISSPWNAMRDIAQNKRMGVFPTDEGFGTDETFDPSKNPLLADTGLEWSVGGPDGPKAPVYANDLFRAVHDAFGHGLEGAGFRARGEENAWQAHVRLFTGSAIGAITSETRGQNSWVNYGPNGEQNQTASAEDTVFADQKVGLMPAWTWMEGRAEDKAPRKIQEGDAATIYTGEPVTFNYSHNTDSATKMFGVPNDPSAPFGRFFEPSGKYVSIVGDNYTSKSDNIETGELTLNNPLVVDNDGLNWKAKLSSRFGGLRGKELSQAVIDAGYDGIITTEGDRYISEIVDLTSFDADIALYQNQGTVKGYYSPSNSLIRLTEAADTTTFLHEFAHFMYEMELTSHRDNPDSANHIASINNWFKRNSDDVIKEASEYAPNTTIIQRHLDAFLDKGTAGDKERDDAIRRAVHEQFARGFEKYLMEGKAPSVELRNAFRTFARWMLHVYRAAKGMFSPDEINLDDGIRQIYDRLLATEEQIAAAEARAEYSPMFTDAAMAGMTEEEFEKYNKAKERVKEKQTETLRDKVIAQLTRRTKKWWKDEMADEVEVQTEAIKKEKVYRAREALKNGDVKMDHAEVKATVGEDVTNKRGIKSRRIPPALTGMTAKGGKGVHPDEAAALLGYGSGDEMLTDIMDAPPIKERAEAAAEKVMAERHGDILNDGTIEKEADDAIVNAERGALILLELKAISKGTRTPTIDKATLKALAQENIQKLSFREIHPAKYRKAEIKAAEESATLLAQGDREGAKRAKARQAMNFYLNKEATEARNATMRIVEGMARYNKKQVRETIMRAENGYWEQIVKILDRFEFRKGASLRSVDVQNEAVQAWMERRMEEDGDALVLSPEVLDEVFTTHWKNVPYDQLKGISDSVKNIEHVARYADKLKVQGEMIDFKKLVQKWTTHIGENNTKGDKFKSQRTTVMEGRSWGRMAMAQMTKIPFLASWLDGGERGGLSFDILSQPFTDAYSDEVKLWEEAGKPVMDLIENRSKADIKRHNTKVFIPELVDENNDGNLYGNQIVAVALNVGNEGNLRKMLLGEGWANPDDPDSITIDNPQLQAILGRMSKSDWDLVQSIWDQMDSLYPKLAEVHRRTTGLTPPKVEAVPVVTPYGEYAGGYYPVKYDANRSARAEENEAKLNAETESMFSSSSSIHASVTTGATNERTQYYAPVRLSLDVVPNHFQEAIHFITHHDAVRQTNKLLKNPEVAKAIKEALGPEEFAQLKPWLNDIAKDGRESNTKMWWDDVLGRLRFGITLGSMGFSASTGLMQFLGLSNIAAEVGPKYTYQAMRQILGSPAKMAEAWDFASSNSKILSNRTVSMDREIKNAMNRINSQVNVKSGQKVKDMFMAFDNSHMLKAIQEASMKHIAYIQTYTVDLPTWYAAYLKEMESSGDEAKAVRVADLQVESLQGSGATKDLAAIMRTRNESYKMFTMFMTFFSALWNINRDLVKGAKSGLYSPTTVAAKLMFLFTIPVAIEMLMRGEFGGEEDEEEKLQKYLTKLALYPVASVPFARDIVGGTIGEFGYTMSPLAGVIERGTSSIPELLTRPLADEDITKSQVKGGTKLVATMLGLPGSGQLWKTGEHLYEVLEEGEELTAREFLLGPDREEK